MTAKGKVNASKVEVGDRIIVKVFRNDAGLITHGDLSQTKTGQDVFVTRVTAKHKARTARGYYLKVAGLNSEIYAEPIQTMILAPEDAPGIKRAYLEALAEDEARTARETKIAEAQTALAETLDEILPAVQSEPEVSAQPATQMVGRGLRTLVDASDVVTIRPEVIVPGLVRDGAPVSVEVPPAKAGQDFSPLPVEGTYRVAFGRVGRHESIPGLDVLVPAAEAWNTSNVLAEAVHAHVRRYLNSSWYTITVDLTYGRVLIEDGRFGEGKATLIRKSA